MNANVRPIEPRIEETSEWEEAFEQVLADEGRDGAAKLLALTGLCYIFSG
jgi:pyruvate dehydrogenase complex dehydrogenase (E1) component